MGGYGSGRNGYKVLTSRKMSLDIRTLKRKGYLNPGMHFSWYWKMNNGQEAGSINICTGNDGLSLNYKLRNNEGGWQTIETLVELDWTSCHFGSRRPWFLCPRCSKRVAILYGGKYFNCRNCHCLAYPSENESQTDRLYRKVWKLREQLNAPINMTRPILFKPKGMHWSTFIRLTDKAHQLESQIYSEIGCQFRIK